MSTGCVSHFTIFASVKYVKCVKYAVFLKVLREMRDFDFLVVDDFLTTMDAAQALKSAFGLGLIDRLRVNGVCHFDTLHREVVRDRAGLILLTDLLQSNNVIVRQDSKFALSREFLEALNFRDLLEAKLDFAELVAGDVLRLFPSLVTDPAHFQRESELFNLFGYGAAVEPSAPNVERTAAWMRFTTCLTRYETQAVLRHHDFRNHRRMLDIGGNSGEFLLRICKAHPHMSGTVFDLPVVCDVGARHVAAQPEAARIVFHKGNALADALPAGFDVVSFKSMLHDWPELQAKRLLTRASQALSPGGTLLIFERGPLEVASGGVPYAMLPMLLFFRSFRGPSCYQEHLHTIGFSEVTVQRIQLDTPFYLVTAKLGE